jgi:uncharacterized protein
MHAVPLMSLNRRWVFDQNPLRCLQRLLVGLLMCASGCAGAAAEPWPELQWEDMMPKDWDPAKEFAGMDLDALDDNDPRANAVLEKLKQAWDKAPVEPSLKGRKIRIAGYVLLLEGDEKAVTEFLIVPYFGACIHTPPPPANQIIHAQSAKPLTGVRMMEPIWTYGTLDIAQHQSDWGASAYRLQVDKVAPYEAPPGTD